MCTHTRKKCDTKVLRLINCTLGILSLFYSSRNRLEILLQFGISITGKLISQHLLLILLINSPLYSLDHCSLHVMLLDGLHHSPLYIIIFNLMDFHYRIWLALLILLSGFLSNCLGNSIFDQVL